MNPKQKVRLTTPKLPPETQREVDELRRIFARTQENLEKLQKSDKLLQKSREISAQVRKLGNDLLMQKGHDVHAHRQIFKYYTQSIAFAPKGTEELVLGYGNRSSLLMHLQHYEQALVDIDKAWELTNDNEYKKKLLARKEKCLGLLNEQNLVKATKRLTLAENRELDKIRAKVMKFKPSASVPCAADCVGVAYNESLGRHLVATRDIKPGEVVIVEKGYSCSPVLNEVYLVCSHCLQYAWNGIPCDECVYAIYCSEECKNEAFNEYHDIECLILKYMQHLIFNTELGIDRVSTIRILIMALRKEGFESIMKEICEKSKEDNLDGLLTDGVLLNNSFKACYNLSPFIQTNGSEYDKLEFNTLQILYLLIEYTDFLVSCIGKSSLAKTTSNLPWPESNDDGSVTIDPRVMLKFKEALMRLKSIAATNGYPIQTGTWQCGYCNDLDDHLKKCHLMRGSAIVPCCSLINHSCTPNIHYMGASKRKVVAFTTCPVKKGEMLCANYKSISVLNGDVKTRQALLKSFTCKCRACLENINIWPYMSDRGADLNKIRVELKKKFSSSFVDSFLSYSIDESEVTEKAFQDNINVSQSMYKLFNYYKAFANSITCFQYIETTMAKVLKEKIYMPNDC